MKHLKSTENLRAIPILMVTSCSDERRMREARKAGVDGYLLKPFTKEIFLHALVALDPNRVAEETQNSIEEAKTEEKTFFDELPSSMKRRIVEMSVVMSFEAGQVILYQDETPEYFYFVIKGEVEETQTATGYKGSLAQSYKKGECFAVTELMAGDPVRGNFSAKTDARVGRLPKVAFEGMLVKFPEIGVTVSRFLCGKARSLDMENDGSAEEASSEEADGGMSGRLEVLDLLSLIQAINLRQKTCELVLPDIDGVISFVRGQVISVKDRAGEGREAFFHILEQKPESFRIVVKSVDAKRNIDVNTTQLLMDSAVQLDEPTYV